jgi:hypothetical protein
MPLQVYRYIILDGKKYAVAQDTYNMKWTRAFSSQLAGNIVRLNFIDRGPGVRTADMTLILETWDPTSLPYQDGITQTWDVQLQNLEASYALIAKSLAFQDPFGRQFVPSGGNALQNWGVYFTNLNEITPKYSTTQQPFVLCEIEITEATQVVA